MSDIEIFLHKRLNGLEYEKPVDIQRSLRIAIKQTVEKVKSDTKDQSQLIQDMAEWISGNKGYFVTHHFDMKEIEAILKRAEGMK